MLMYPGTIVLPKFPICIPCSIHEIDCYSLPRPFHCIGNPYMWGRWMFCNHPKWNILFGNTLFHKHISIHLSSSGNVVLLRQYSTCNEKNIYLSKLKTEIYLLSWKKNVLFNSLVIICVAKTLFIIFPRYILYLWGWNTDNV